MGWTVVGCLATSDIFRLNAGGGATERGAEFQVLTCVFVPKFKTADKVMGIVGARQDAAGAIIRLQDNVNGAVAQCRDGQIIQVETGAIVVVLGERLDGAKRHVGIHDGHTYRSAIEFGRGNDVQV